jgi:symplekin
MEDDIQPEPNEMAIVKFELPVPSQLPPQSLRLEFQASIDRILQSIRILDKSVSHRAGMATKSPTLDSLAFNEWDKEAWITLLSRLCARALNSPDPANHPATNLSNVFRERLFEYIMIDFREHMDLAISWLTEEWYNDTLSGESGVYNKWATRIFDNIIPFIDGRDPKDKDFKIFLRFLGDLPLIAPLHVQKLRTLCLDPERQKLGFAAIKYLLLLRPPARDACVELCVDLFKNRMHRCFERVC